MKLWEYVDRLVAELLDKSINAAAHGKPTMWAYYRRMREHVIDTYVGLKAPGDIVEQANTVEQLARKMCLISRDSGYGDKALWYAYSVYARKIMRQAGFPSRGWVSMWLPLEAAKIRRKETQ